MVDLYLEAKLKGDSFSPKKIELNKYDTAIEEYAKKYVEDLPDENFKKDQLISLEMKKIKLIEELKEIAKISELSPYIQTAFNTLSEEGPLFFEEEQFEALSADLFQAKKNLEQLNLSGPIPAKIQDILKLTDASLDAIFNLALKSYNDAKYYPSLSLFVLLTTLIPTDPDYWYRLGIAAQKEGKDDLALQAYHHAIALDPDTVGARLFAAACYLSNKKYDEARVMCLEAKNLLKKHSEGDVWPKFLSSLENLLEGAGS